MNFQRQNHCDCFDYPVAWCFFRSHCRETHGFDPGSVDPPISFPPRPKVIHVADPRMEQIQSSLISLRSALQDHIKPKSKKVTKYEGIKE